MFDVWLLPWPTATADTDSAAVGEWWCAACVLHHRVDNLLLLFARLLNLSTFRSAILEPNLQHISETDCTDDFIIITIAKEVRRLS